MLDTSRMDVMDQQPHGRDVCQCVYKSLPSTSSASWEIGHQVSFFHSLIHFVSHSFS